MRWFLQLFKPMLRIAGMGSTMITKKMSQMSQLNISEHWTIITTVTKHPGGPGGGFQIRRPWRTMDLSKEALFVKPEKNAQESFLGSLHRTNSSCLLQVVVLVNGPFIECHAARRIKVRKKRTQVLPSYPAFWEICILLLLMLLYR